MGWRNLQITNLQWWKCVVSVKQWVRSSARRVWKDIQRQQNWYKAVTWTMELNRTNVNHENIQLVRFWNKSAGHDLLFTNRWKWNDLYSTDRYYPTQPGFTRLAENIRQDNYFYVNSNINFGIVTKCLDIAIEFVGPVILMDSSNLGHVDLRRVVPYTWTMGQVYYKTQQLSVLRSPQFESQGTPTGFGDREIWFHPILSILDINSKSGSIIPTFLEKRNWSSFF